MDTERARAELRRLLAELPEERRDTWRQTLDDIADAFAHCRSEARDLSAQVADLRAADALAGKVSAAIGESTATIAEAREVMREARLALARRFPMPDGPALARLGAAAAAVLGPLVGAIVYALSGGAIALPVSGGPLP